MTRARTALGGTCRWAQSRDQIVNAESHLTWKFTGCNPPVSQVGARASPCLAADPPAAYLVNGEAHEQVPILARPGRQADPFGLADNFDRGW